MKYFYFLVSQSRNDLNQSEVVEPNKRVKIERWSINEKYPNRQQAFHQLITTDDTSTQLTGLSTLFEGLSSKASNNSRLLDGRQIDKKCKGVLEFVYTESSIMFYPNIILIVS